MKCSLPSRQTRNCNLLDSALTTETPTAVQAARHLVGILVEFSAGVQLGHDDLGRGNAFALVDVDGNAAAVVAHGDGIVGV